MSWWRIGEGDDVIGDDPADVISGVLDRLAAEVRPSLTGFLDAVAAVLSARGEELLDDPPEPRIRRLLVLPPTPEAIKAGAQDSGNGSGERLRLAAWNALAGIAAAYQERWKRRPRLHELLALLAFVLRPVPRRWFSHGADIPVATLDIEFERDLG